MATVTYEPPGHPLDWAARMNTINLTFDSEKEARESALRWLKELADGRS